MSDWDDPHQQALRYAADLATLYEEVEHVRGNLHALRKRLFEIARAGLQLVSCLSVEQVADRLLVLVRELLDTECCGVYGLQAGRLRLVSCSPAGSFRTVAPVGLKRLSTLESGSSLEARWFATDQTDSLCVIPLVGRQREVGLIACVRGAGGELSRAELRALLDLLGSYGGIAFENLTAESRRPEAYGGPAQEGESFAELLGNSSDTASTVKALCRLESLDATVLFQGETGTGKSLLARTLHARSPRGNMPCVVVNCSAIPTHLVESELFGHEAGAFTGATRLHRGKVEQAAGGTLFLDEVAELPVQSQAKLLTFIETKRFTRVGGERELSADVRIVAATNRELKRCVDEGSFRADLYYRLHVFAIDLPPLRSREADVCRLATQFVSEVASRYSLPAPNLTPEVERLLMAYRWPGNVRELRNVIEKALVLSEPGTIDPRLLPTVSLDAGPATPAWESADSPSPTEELGTFSQAKARVVERWERAYFTAILRSTGGNLAQAAKRASMDKKYLRDKVKRLKIDIEQIREAGSSAV